MLIDSYKNQIINADFREVLKNLPDKSVDLLLTDPPYGIDILGQRAKKDPHGKYGYTVFDNKEWDCQRPSKEDFEEMIRVSKNQVIWGGNYFADLLPASQGWFVWDKGQRDFSLADGELAWTSFDKALRIYTYSRSKAIQDGKIHPTQKPVALFAWVLRLRTKENDLILDCFSGSATTAIACHRTGRNFICIERDIEHYKKSVQRLQDEVAQVRLFRC